MKKKKELFVWLGHLPKYSCKKKKKKKRRVFFPHFVVCDTEESPKTVFHVRRHEWYMFERRSRGKKKTHKMKGHALPPHYSTQHDALSTGTFSFPFLKHNLFFFNSSFAVVFLLVVVSVEHENP